MFSRFLLSESNGKMFPDLLSKPGSSVIIFSVDLLEAFVLNCLFLSVGVYLNQNCTENPDCFLSYYLIAQVMRLLNFLRLSPPKQFFSNGERMTKDCGKKDFTPSTKHLDSSFP